MCWSWQVSLIFATAQWIIIAYLIYRNQFLDRIFATMQAFIAAQETLQFLLWAFGIDDDTTATSCPAFNTFCSYVLLFIVQSIMPIYGLMGSFISHKTEKGTWRFKVSLIYTFCGVLWLILYLIAAIYYDFYRDDIHCTYKGPNGHQVWAFMDIEDLNAAIFWINNFLWNILILLFLICVHPSWPLFPVAVYSSFSLLVFNRVFATTYEYGSLWCWANFAQAIWYLFTYQIAKYIVENDLEDKNGRCCQYLFTGTKALYNGIEQTDEEKKIKSVIQQTELTTVGSKSVI